MDDLRLVYITCADTTEGRAIGRTLVEERLAACVNLLPGMQSCFHWQGRIEEAAEVVLIAKTRAALAEAVVARVKVLHSATVPCVVILPILGGNPDYLEWLLAETGS